MPQSIEARARCWRAVAVFDDRGERLLYLGGSSSEVRAGLEKAFAEVLDEEERDCVRSIALQRWDGASDAGRWVHQANLLIPLIEKLGQID